MTHRFALAIPASLVLILLSAGLLASCWPLAQTTLQAQSDRLARAGQGTSGRERQLDFQLALHLNPRNHIVALELAKAQLANHQPVAALASLARAGQGREADRVRLPAELEANQLSAAQATADRLAGASSTTPSELPLIAFTYLLDHRIGETEQLKPRLASPEALQRVQHAQSSPIALASELYVLGLPNSATELLARQPPSLARCLLLGQLYSSRHTPAALLQAKDQFALAVQINPANLEAHLGLQAAWRDLGDPASAAQQQTLIHRLQVGQP